MVDDQGNAFGILSDPGSYDPGDTTVPDSQGDGSGATIATPGTIDWLNPGAEGSPLFDDSDTDWPSGLSIPDQPSGDVDDSNETSTEVGSSVSTTNVRDSGPTSDEERVDVDPITGQPYTENTDTGQTQSIQSSGVDSMGNPIYQAPTAAGGDTFEVDDAGATISTLGPLDTSGWDTTPQEENGAWDDTSGALTSGEPGSSYDDGSSNDGSSTDEDRLSYDGGSSDDDSGSYDDSSSYDSGSDNDSSNYDDSSSYDSGSYDSSSVSEGAPVDEAPAVSEGGDDGGD